MTRAEDRAPTDRHHVVVIGGGFGGLQAVRKLSGLPVEVRRRILSAFEAAEVEPDPARRAAWLTFVVVGAGPTGVELAGQVAEIARETLRGDFRAIDTRAARILLVELADRVLPLFPRR